MKAKNVFAVAAFGVLMAAGCDDSDVLGINNDCSNLYGVFRATSATVTSTQGTSTTADLLANGGAFDITFGGTDYSASYRAGANGTPIVTSGTPTRRTSDNLVIGQAVYPGAPTVSSFNCKIEDHDKLTLEAPTSSYVFAGESEARNASVRITLTRQTDDDLDI